MTEAVRLVVWDLDETFWQGTLTEGGYSLIPENIEIVKTLARRGIMSSICSKNDHDKVKKILEDAGIWEYFIFPSINWDPKGARLKRLIEDVQLRAPTVLFIDDNPMNLNEATHFAPGVQISDEKIIPSLLDNPLLRGKDDSGLTRLAQYRLLQEKKKDEVVAGDNEEFLRLSGIKVFISDPADNIDRAIELVNRTNQLNFTKKRLSEDMDVARDELSELLARPGMEAGLVHVVDKYGDYGDVGLYVVDTGKDVPELVHFCFSCRTLNMGIENWVYRQLGSPHLEVVGEVIGDVIGDQRDIDWITLGTDPGAAVEEAAAPVGQRPFHRVIFRGGCEQRAFSHFFTNVSDEVIGEFNIQRFGIPIRPDHSCFFRMSADGVDAETMDILKRVGFLEEDVHSALFEETEGQNLAILSFWTDARFGVHRHRDTGMAVPIFVPSTETDDPDIQRIKAVADSEYERDRLIPEDEFKANLRAGLARMPANMTVAILLARPFVEVGDRIQVHNDVINLNRWVEEVAGEFEGIHLFRIEEYVKSTDEVVSSTHFRRQVYHRLFEDFVNTLVPGAQPAELSQRTLPSQALRNANAEYRALDKKSKDDVLRFHQTYRNEILQGSALPVNFALALIGLGLKDEAADYLLAGSDVGASDAPDLVRRRVAGLIKCGLHDRAEEVAGRVTGSPEQDTLREELLQTIRSARGEPAPSYEQTQSAA